MSRGKGNEKTEHLRKVEVVVISDVHLGTYGCNAKALESYLRTIKPKTLILNGDIIDIWQFSKKYWPSSHMKVIRRIFSFLSKKTNVIFIPGNHDETLRRFCGTNLGNLSVRNKAVLNLGGEKVWIFHGDAFDISMQHSRWLAKLGAVGYDLLILMNSAVNFMLVKLGRPRISFASRIKKSVKKAVSYVNSFEDTVAQIAVDQGFDTVICGHIHQAADKRLFTGKGSVRYLNSGDWIENLTALEYNNGEWSLYRHTEQITHTEEPEPDSAELFQVLKNELLESSLFQTEDNFESTLRHSGHR
jgi:UDP-2,3-diacylglucosamine pyrophosphatase LpxH